jgi:hypothetical protein
VRSKISDPSMKRSEICSSKNVTGLPAMFLPGI